MGSTVLAVFISEHSVDRNIREHKDVAGVVVGSEFGFAYGFGFGFGRG